MRIYVGNLNYQTTEDQLTQLFAQHGEVASTSLVTDKYSGNSKGFAFIEAASAEAGKAMITALAGSEFDGRNLQLDEATPRFDNRNSDGGGSNY